MEHIILPWESNLNCRVLKLAILIYWTRKNVCDCECFFIYREVPRLQQFYNKSLVVSYYWFKFEFSTEITFLTQQ